MVVLVTGANGQLGQALQSIAGKYPQLDFVFCASAELDIAEAAECEQVFKAAKPSYCINAAAYTAVDKAESEPEKAFRVNVTGAKNIAESCKKHNAVLLHVSTDFVFDGEKASPYKEDDLTHPTGVYGQTKLEGEKAVRGTFENYFIIRTSWVYSQFGHNFLKTMLRLGREKDTLSVVNDQIGTPTNAIDLAEALVSIILFKCGNGSRETFGIYNFSNEGQCSWYDFAKKIFEIHKIQIDLRPIPTSAFPTAAQRPKYSVMDKAKIKNAFIPAIRDWDEALKSIEI